MFKQIFSAMNEVLDDVAAQYPIAKGDEKQELESKLELLKSMSDMCIEQWLQFEEKMASFYQHSSMNFAESSEFIDPLNEETAVHYEKGQGYYQLMMFSEAIKELEKTLQLQKDYLPARLFLGLSYLHDGQLNEAFTHLQWINTMTNQPSLKALTYNGLACIQAQKDNLDQAKELFSKAREMDPSFAEPITDLDRPITEQIF